MEEMALVVEVGDDFVVVESLVKSSCSQCHQVDTCGSGQVAKALPQPKLSLTIPTLEQFKEGEQVLISIPEQALLSVAWQVYLWPLIGLFAMAGLAQFAMTNQLLNHEVAVILFSILGGYLGFRLAKWRVCKQQTNDALTPKIKQRLVPLSQAKSV